MLTAYNCSTHCRISKKICAATLRTPLKSSDELDHLGSYDVISSSLISNVNIWQCFTCYRHATESIPLSGMVIKILKVANLLKFKAKILVECRASRYQEMYSVLGHWFASASLANPYCQSTWSSVCMYVCMSVCLSGTLRSNIWETKGDRGSVTMGSL